MIEVQRGSSHTIAFEWLDTERNLVPLEGVVTASAYWLGSKQEDAVISNQGAGYFEATFSPAQTTRFPLSSSCYIKCTHTDSAGRVMASEPFYVLVTP